MILLVALTLFNLFNLNQGKDASQKALDLETFALSTQRLREALLNEQSNVLNMVYTELARFFFFFYWRPETYLWAI